MVRTERFPLASGTLTALGDLCDFPFKLHTYLGVHRTDTDTSRTYTFRYFAPSATAVYLVSDFLSWENGKRMTRLASGVWELTLTSERSLEGASYKYKVYRETVSDYCSDPYATREEGRGGYASLIATEAPVCTDSAAWEAHRRAQGKKPLHFLEVSLTSLVTKKNRLPYEEGAAYRYDELARALTVYAKSTGYTHVKLLSPSLFEKNSLFAPAPRHGTPDDYAACLSYLHQNGIGTILALPLPHTEEDACRVLAASDFMLSHYPIDGLWFEAPMDGQDGQMSTDTLFSAFCSLQKRYPHAIFGCDCTESPESVNNLAIPEGFLVRHTHTEDVLTDHLALPPALRAKDQERLIDALVSQALASQSKRLTRGGKESLMMRFFGSYEQKFSENRLYHMMLIASGSPKLSFMLASLAPFRPWQDSLLPEWYMADFKLHRAHRRFIRALNRFYLSTPLLWDEKTAITCHHKDPERNVFSLKRKNKDGELLFIFNCSDTLYTDYTLPAAHTAYRECFSSDEESFAGEGYVNRLAIPCTDAGLTLNLAPLSAVILEPNPYKI
ncbi:MAG: alpha amylase C-terminal domain-containing protein [Clostridia bacterium]|nr:alpha amylase C-terminal domain-containing protein [Clostridia bacterium]